MPEIKPVFKCAEHFKDVFKYSQCLLTISVGQEVHEGEKFSKTLMLVNQTFQSCILLIDDTLQRHTMAIGTEFTLGDYLLDISRQEGKAWLERNRSVIDALTIPYHIITWDKWLDHPKFSEIKSELEMFYDVDESFKEAIDSTINEFLTRYDRRFEDRCYLDSPVARKLCKTYLIEECTAMCLWPELNCQFEVYPGHRNAAMTETHNRFVLPKYIDLLHPVRVKFKNKGQLRAQVFSTLEEVEAMA